ncbi:hypothetical protein SETIT_2G217600v2 [Setaria italica]|uniref:Uncharacterized protein n=1 Tax=Setaria italica TaxID=4555 RepID=A0A368Q2D8_SETIT|nr:hypothetical protein SETIT_2G217600v2 [Setaria italica]
MDSEPSVYGRCGIGGTPSALRSICASRLASFPSATAPYVPPTAFVIHHHTVASSIAPSAHPPLHPLPHRRVRRVRLHLRRRARGAWRDPQGTAAAILSAGTFISAFVISTVTLIVAPCAVPPASFMREMFFYLLTSFELFYIYLNAKPEKGCRG